MLTMLQAVPAIPSDAPMWTALALVGGYLIKQWWMRKAETAEKLRVEQRLEEEWSHDPANLLGSRNPGRSLPQLVEILHIDLQAYKRESNERFERIHRDLGEIKGKLGIDRPNSC